jgi:hypothetical protein
VEQSMHFSQEKVQFPKLALHRFSPLRTKRKRWVPLFLHKNGQQSFKSHPGDPMVDFWMVQAVIHVAFCITSVLKVVGHLKTSFWPIILMTTGWRHVVGIVDERCILLVSMLRATTGVDNSTYFTRFHVWVGTNLLFSWKQVSFWKRPCGLN